MVKSHLAGFAPGRSKNTMLRLAAEAFGIPLNRGRKAGAYRADAGEESALDDRDNRDRGIPFQPQPDGQSAFPPAGNPAPAPTFENDFPLSADANMYPRLRKSYFDENSRKTRLGRQLRSPHVLYDSATNRIDRLEAGAHPHFYDEDTEQYIIDRAQKRASPRYEYLLPDEAEEKRQNWERENSRSVKGEKWNPLQIWHGFMDSFTKTKLNGDELAAFHRGGPDDEKQRYQDYLTGEAAKLDFKRGGDESFFSSLGESQVKSSRHPLAAGINAASGIGDKLAAKRLQLEREPFSFFRNNRRVRELMQNENLGITDAIEEFKKRAVEHYMEPYYKNKLPADLVSELFKRQFQDQVIENIFDGLYQGITENKVGGRAEDLFRKYVYE